MDQAITGDWLKPNIKIDRQVTFGSDAYFELAADPIARAFMQSANNVLFMYKGEIIEIMDDDPAFAVPDQVSWTEHQPIKAMDQKAPSVRWI